MKLSTLASTLGMAAAMSMISVSTFAVERSFEKGSDDIETQACYAAAIEGMEATKALLEENIIKFNTFKRNVLCNGMKIERFVAKYSDKSNSEDGEESVVRVVALSAMDRSKESRFCLDAVTLGEKAARAKYKMNDEDIRCNGKSIQNFLRSFDNTKVVNSGDLTDTIAKTE